MKNPLMLLCARMALRSAVALLAASTVRADTTWTGSVSPYWINSGNWSNDLPNAAATTYIHSNGTIILDGDNAGAPYRTGWLYLQFGGLTIDGGKLQSTQVQIAPGSGTAASAIVRGAGAFWTVTRDLGIGGAGSGALTLSDGAALNLTAADGAGDIYLGSDPGGVGVLNIGVFTGSATGGTINFSSPSSKVRLGSAAGTSSATINFNQSDTFTLDAGILSQQAGAGSIVQRGMGTTVLAGDNTGFTGVTTISSGTLRLLSPLGGSIVNNAVLEWSVPSDSTFTGSISGTGQLVVNSGHPFTPSATNTYSGGTLVQGSHLTLPSATALGSGPITLSNATFRWAPGVTTDISDRLVLAGAGVNVLDPNGNDIVFESRFASGGNLFVWSQSFSGSLTLAKPGTQSLGSLTVGMGLSLFLRDGASISASGDTLITGSVVASGSGTSISMSTLDGGNNGTGSITIQNGATASATVATISGGYSPGQLGITRVTGAGSKLSVTDLYVDGGRLVLDSGGSLSPYQIWVETGSLEFGLLDGSSTPGQLDLTNNIEFRFESEIGLNHGAGSLTLDFTNKYFFGGGIIVQRGAGTSHLTGSSLTGFTGTTYVENGLLAMSGSAFTNSSVIVTGGTFAVGSPTATGTINLAGFSINSGVIAFDLAGSAVFDHLSANGSLALSGGTLRLTLLDGYTPQTGATFDLLDWTGGLTGSFAALDLPAIGEGLAWDTSGLYTTGSLAVVAVPEPATLGLLFLGALAAGRLGLSRRQLPRAQTSRRQAGGSLAGK